MSEVKILEENLSNVVPIQDLKVNEDHDRFTLKLSSYWQHFGEDPLGAEIAASMILDTFGIEPYIRKFVADEEPKYLSFGDIPREDVGYIIVANLEGTKLQANPYPEELDDIKKRVVSIDGYEIHPFGMPFMGRPSLQQPVIVRCEHGQASLQLYIFPR